MGDASLPAAQAYAESDRLDDVPFPARDSLREVNILVTGFGSFKSFATNPSYLIASTLARTLNPESPSVTAALERYIADSHTSNREPDTRPYRINVYVYPHPVRVAYDVVRDLIPKLIADPSSTTTTDEPSPDFVPPPTGFDYVLHIGMAAGRENYTLETVAHRDHYRLKDVDDRDGSRGEAHWRDLNLPAVLDVGWNKEDVLTRWEALTRRREDEFENDEMVKAGWKRGGGMTLVETARLRSHVFLGKGRRAAVKLSRDAGRYLCEFIFYTSLGTRWREARDDGGEGAGADARPAVGTESAREKVGKVAFLHVPGGTSEHDIARGVRVAESAILAIVGSWEDGQRNPDVYGGMEGKGYRAGHAAALYEQKGTGDR